MRDTQPMGLKYHAFFCCCILFGSYPMSVVFILSYWKLPDDLFLFYRMISQISEKSIAVLLT